MDCGVTTICKPDTTGQAGTNFRWAAVLVYQFGSRLGNIEAAANSHNLGFTIRMLRFAVLTHDHPFLHWDFLLEQGSVCRTWRLLQNPDRAGQIPAEALPDHRLMYLEYEGPVSGDRGTVTQWDSGTFEWLSHQPGLIEVRLTGRMLNGIFRLIEVDASWVWERSSPPTG